MLSVRAPGARVQGHRAWGLASMAGGVAALLAIPLAFLVLELVNSGWSEVKLVLFRHLTGELIWNTVALTVAVTVGAAVVGTGCAWVVERTDLPGRRVLAVLLVLPLAVPDFVVSFGWVQLAPGVTGFWGALLVMTFTVYPFVYLPVAASIRRLDPGTEEVARSLGRGPMMTFATVTLAQLRLAVAGGGLVVALVVLAEYGAFEILRYQTFTTEIFTEYQNFQMAAAASLSIVLVLGALMVVGADGAIRGRAPIARSSPFAGRPVGRTALGRARWLALVVCLVVLALGLGVPFAEIFSLLSQASGKTLPGAASIASALGHSLAYAAPAAAIASVCAMPLAILTVRRPGRVPSALEKSSYLILGLPGIVVALSLVYMSERYGAGALYGSAWLLIVAYAMMFFPLAFVAGRASLAQAPHRLEEVARSLGASRVSVLLKVVVPLVAPGVAAGFCLVLLEAVTELTATLVLVPPSTQTLSTQFWAFQSNGLDGQAAIFALVMVGLAAVPLSVLSRFFGALQARGAAR
ncbi:MAG: ABC transporter permease [Acidimicrobiales bacterium]